MRSEWIDKGPFARTSCRYARPGAKGWYVSWAKSMALPRRKTTSSRNIHRVDRDGCCMAYLLFHARTYSMLNVDGKSLSLGIPNHSGMVSLSNVR